MELHLFQLGDVGVLCEQIASKVQCDVLPYNVLHLALDVDYSRGQLNKSWV